MTYFKWGFRAVLLLIVVGFLHYTLPQHDIVRIVDTEVKRVDQSAGNQENQSASRDVRFIYTKLPDGRDMVYRNEDTGWGWPPYFKFDSDNLTSQAADGRSTKQDPRWFVVRHYGWRVTLLSTYPNILSLRPATGPDERIIPWFNIVFLSTLGIIFLTLRRMFIIWRQRSVDPVINRLDQEMDQTAHRWGNRWRRIFGDKP